MRLTLATLLLLATSPAWAGDLLVAEPTASAGPAATPPQDAPPEAASPRDGTPRDVPGAVAAAVPYPALYDAPLFGHAAPVAAKVDETALRFYAAQKNRARVDAEIKRLRALHPAWKVPANLYAASAGNDEQPLWDMFAAGRTEELRVAIQAREKREAGWRPSADLLAKMARQETTSTLKALADAKAWHRLLALADAHPDILGCGTVDLDWRVAEAFAATGAAPRAYEIDAAILATCHDGAERLATVRKAVDLLPAPFVERLVAAGRTLADGSGEFDEVRLDLGRRQVGAATADPALPDVPATSLDALGAATLRSGEPADAALLGWYHFGRKRWAEADGWFRLGLDRSGGDPKMAEGHALALRELGRPAAAEELAYAWRDRSSVMRGLFVSLMTDRLAKPDGNPVDPTEMADFSAILHEDRSVPAAAALGWAAYGRQDFDGAALWFGNAVDWAGTGDLPEKVVEGYGLALKGLGRLDAAEDFLYGRRDRSPAVGDAYVAVAVAALSQGAAGAAPTATGPDLPAMAISPERMDRFAEAIRTARSTAGATALGWRNLRDGRPAAAADWFREAERWSPNGVGDVKTAEGLVLALKAAGDLGGAEDLAYGRIADSAQLREAYRGIMTAALTTPALAERLPEASVMRFAAFVEGESSSEGAQALGWYRLGQDLPGGSGCGYGVDWFRRAVAWSPDGKGTAKGNEGYAEALQRAGHDLAAGDIAFAWADTTPDMRALAIKVTVASLTRDLFAPALSEDRLDRLSRLVRDDRSAAGAQALAWYRYRDAGNGYGVDWFEDAIRWAPDGRPDAKTVEGYAAALRDVGRLADAEEVLFPWVDKVVPMRDLYIDTVVSELTLDNPPEPMPHDRLARFIAVATPLKSAAAAQALGWYRLARHEYADAVIWFKYAVDWWPQLPADADRYTYVLEGYRPLMARLALKPEDYRRTPRAFTSRAHGPEAAQHRYVDTFGGLATTWTGYALSLRAAGRATEAEDVALAWRDRWPMLGRLFIDMAVEALTKPGGDGIAPERLKLYASVIEEQHDPAGAAALGWAASGRHDPTEAAVWFKAAIDWRAVDAEPDLKVVTAYVDALRSAGRPEEAFVAASAWVDRLPDLKADRLDAALDMLAAPDGASVFAPDRLAQAVALAKADSGARSAAALGWYALGLGDAAAALPSFKAAVTRAEAAPTTGGATAPAPADAAVLPKAVEGFALALRRLGRDADALTFVEAWSARIPALSATLGDIVAEALSREGGKAVIAPDEMDRMAAAATRTRSVPAAAAFGWYAYGHRDWAKAASWFATGTAWAPDHRAPLKLVDGYALSLHHQCRFDDAEAVALSRMDEPEGDALRQVYVDSVSDRISRARTGVALPSAEATRFAAATLKLSSPNGAQALGWYAYRSRQFPAAAAWFEKAVAWHPTEAEVYGLAVSYRRAGDADALARVLSLYEGRFASLAMVRRAGMGGRDVPIPDFGDLARRGCADGDRADGAVDPAPPPPHAEGAGPPLGAPVVAAVARVPATPQADAAAPVDAPPAAEAPPREDAPAPERRPPLRAERPSPTIRRPVAVAPRLPEQVAGRGTTMPAGGDASAQASAALAAKDYAACLRILERRPIRNAADHATAGWCLLGLGRSAEAAEAFRAAETGGRGRTASDGALGETLSHLRDGDTAAAVSSAARTNLDATKRRTLGLQILTQQAQDAYKNGHWAETLALLRRRAAYGPETRDLVMLRGWALYHNGDYGAAQRAFDEADAQLSDADSRGAIAVVTTAMTPSARR